MQADITGLEGRVGVEMEGLIGNHDVSADTKLRERRVQLGAGGIRVDEDPIARLVADGIDKADHEVRPTLVDTDRRSPSRPWPTPWRQA